MSISDSCIGDFIINMRRNKKAKEPHMLPEPKTLFLFDEPTLQSQKDIYSQRNKTEGSCELT